MSVPDSTLLELLVSQVWACLSVPIHKNPLFGQVFTSKEVVFHTCEAASFSFCPGLLETWQSPNPPPVSFFSQLPSLGSPCWAIYALVLGKQDSSRKIYIGSATNSIFGAKHRLHKYERLSQGDLTVRRDLSIPNLVRDALKNGYEITNVGLLAWCAMPSAADVPFRRLFMVALECAFTFLFWTIRPTDKDYGMGSCCPWPRHLFHYSGLCSHNPLIEAVLGNFELTAEQLEAVSVARKKRKTESKRLEQRKIRKRQREADPVGYAMKQNQVFRDRLARKGDEMRAQWAQVRANVKASNKFNCSLCALVCSSQYQFDQHNASAMHLRKVAEAKAGIRYKFCCELCAYDCQKLSLFEKHKRTAKHIQREAEAKSSSGSA